MSKFVRAMERAARERALLEESRRQNGDPSAADLAVQALSELDEATAAPETTAPPSPSPTNRPSEPSLHRVAHRPAESQTRTGRNGGAESGAETLTSDRDRVALHRAVAPTPAIGHFRLKPEAKARELGGDTRPVTPAGSPELRGQLDDRLVSLVRPMSFEAEQYRALRLMVEQRHAAHGVSVVAVSSPGTAEGKTTTAINLAGALAQNPAARVLLVDADLRHSSIASRLGVADAPPPGLAQAVLDPSLSLGDLVVRYRAFNLHVLMAGRPQNSPYELFRSPRLGERLAEARRLYDYVVVDTPPLIPVPDSRLLAHWVDGVLLVVAAHKTPHRMLEESLTLADPEKLLALVFNGDEDTPAGYYKGYYSTPSGVAGLRR